eukprot:SAG31_NODE_534_length_14370_cov_121.217434_5_plen_104_part_00
MFVRMFARNTRPILRAGLFVFQRKNLQEKKLQVDNIKACDAVHRYLTNVRVGQAAALRLCSRYIKISQKISPVFHTIDHGSLSESSRRHIIRVWSTENNGRVR